MTIGSHLFCLFSARFALSLLLLLMALNWLKVKWMFDLFAQLICKLFRESVNEYKRAYKGRGFLRNVNAQPYST